ncbi:hypothetical protein WA158_004302 [Blastocystis sp. Blastoise]
MSYQLFIDTNTAQQGKALACLTCAAIAGVTVDLVAETDLEKNLPVLKSADGVEVSGFVEISKTLIKDILPSSEKWTAWILENEPKFIALWTQMSSGLKDVTDKSSDEIKEIFSNVNKCIEELTAALGSNTFINGESISLDDVLICSLIYASIAKKNFFPCPASIARQFISFMKYVKKCAAVVVLEGEAPKGQQSYFTIAITQLQAFIKSKMAPKKEVPKAAAKEKEGNASFKTAAVEIATERLSRPVDNSIKLPKEGEKNILITSALPYVNNVPHLGNLIGCVLSADVFARYCRERKVNCIYICGTDEYGTATETKAQQENLTPRQICTKYHKLHREIYKWFDISFDYLGRTSTENPREDKEWPQTQIAQDIFKKLYDNNKLVEQSTEQVYCEQCGRFLADRFIEGTCPVCGYDKAGGDQCDKCGNLLNAVDLINPICKVGGKEHKVQKRSTTHLFLNLPELEDRLREWVNTTSVEGEWTDNATFITNSWLSNGLKPRCITRDLKWGTPVPLKGYEDKVFYVWFDAPIGYISITANYTKDWKQWWQNPKNVELYQFMGKDNIPFHTVIFPCTLMGTEENWTLLKHVSCTEYLNYENGKFSKSKGTGVFGDQAKDTKIPSEVWRYYLLCNRPEQSDSQFLWDDLAEKNNNELLKNLGNFINRGMTFIYNKMNKSIPAQGELKEREQTLIDNINKTLKDYNYNMSKTLIKAGLKSAMEISRLGNQYLQDAEPWTLFKSDRTYCNTIMNLCANLVYLIANIFEPFMPAFADKVCYQLNYPHGDIPDSFEFILPADHVINPILPLFKKIEPEEIAAYRARFAGQN